MTCKMTSQYKYTSSAPLRPISNSVIMPKQNIFFAFRLIHMLRRLFLEILGSSNASACDTH
jgi:hypothetical protein